MLLLASLWFEAESGPLLAPFEGYSKRVTIDDGDDDDDDSRALMPKRAATVHPISFRVVSDAKCATEVDDGKGSGRHRRVLPSTAS